MLKTVRDYEKAITRFNKVSLDIGFLQKCKLFHIFPTFLNFKFNFNFNFNKQEFHDESMSPLQGGLVELRYQPEVFSSPQFSEF